VRIDQPDQADEPSDAHAARHGRLARDNPNTASSVRIGAISGDSSANSPRAESDSGLRAERNAAQRAAVDAVYRQDAIDRGHARKEKLEPENVTSSMRRIEAADAEFHAAGHAGPLEAKARFAEPADLKKGEVPRAPDGGMPAATRGGSVPAEHNGWIRDRAIRGDRGGEHRAVPATSALVHHNDLPQGYTSSPALKRDPYHPDSVAGRSAANRDLYAATSRDQAAFLGYTTRIPAQKVFFDSHGQDAFTNGKTYITPDIDSHNVTSGWKMFNRRGVRLGTYDFELNYVKE
jgi:hypothetical protein